MSTLAVPSVRSKGTRGASNCPIPATTSGNDIMVVVVTGNITTTGGGPSLTGFTRLMAGVGAGTTGRYIAYFLKRLTGPESAGTYTPTVTNATVGSCQAFSVKNCEITGPLYTAFNSFNTVTGGSVPLPTTSGLTIGDFALWTYASTGATITVTSPSGWVEESDTSAGVFHTLSQIEDHTSTDSDTMTATGTTLGAITTFLTLPARLDPDPLPNSTRIKDSIGSVAIVAAMYKDSSGVVTVSSPYYKDSSGTVIAL